MGSSDQKNVFLAVILSGLVLFTWQSYFVPTPVVQDINKVEGNLPEKELKAVTTGEVANSDSAPTAIVKKTKETIKVENKLFTISNSGHSLSVTSDLVVKDFHKEDVKTSFLEVMGKENPVRIQVLTTAGFKNLNFNFIKTSEDRLEGSNALTAARATIVIGPKGVVSVSISSTNDLTYRFKFTSETKELENRKIRLYTVYNNSKLDTYNVGSEDTSDGNYDWVGLDFNYNIFALTFPKKLVGKVATNEKA